MRQFYRNILVVAALCLLFVACAGGGTTATPTATPTSGHGEASTSFQLTGLVHTPGQFALADLQAFPKVTVTTKTTPLGQHTFGGALLYDILQKAQIITDSSRKNDILRKVALVSGTDGYTVAVALGEIVPKFAGKQVILAYEEDGKPLPQADGFARLVVPGDVFAGRYVSNVAMIEVRSPGPIVTPSTRKPSSAFYLVGSVNTPAKYELTALKALKATEITVQAEGPNGLTTATYTGVLLNDLLNSAGLQLNKQRKNDFLRKGVVAVGSDGYSALVVGGEIAPKFGNIQVLIAYEVNGQPLPDTDGFARIVVPGDHAAGRFVSNLVELQVLDTTPS